MGRNRGNKIARQVELTDELKMREIAKLFMVSTQTVRNWLNSGKLGSCDIPDVMAFYCEEISKRKRKLCK